MAASSKVRPRLALGGTVALVVAAVAVVVAIGDPPVLRHRDVSGGPSKAAIAIRDHVVPFQKWGTRMFTLPHLRESYDQVYYLTQARPGDQHEQFQQALDQALRKYDHVDLFLLAHGNRFIHWVAEQPPDLRSKLRLVYNTGCGQSVQADEWLHLGADAYVGHPSLRSISPAFYYFFLRRWIRGYSLAESVELANRAAKKRLSWFGQDRGDVQATAILSGNRDLWVADP